MEPTPHPPAAGDAPETRFAEELAALAGASVGPKPAGWRLSPRMVRLFALGGQAETATGPAPIMRKHLGDPGPVETAIAALAAGRALLLLGPPGVGKSHLSALLAAAIGGESRLVVQGSAGTEEAALRYGWDYARLISEGPSREALAPSPVMRAMEGGRIARVEELTRMPGAAQDALIGPLSEGAIAVAELGIWVAAAPGFGLIATANDRDRGVTPLSAALMRRCAVVRLGPPETLAAEATLLSERLAARALPEAAEIPAPMLLEAARLARWSRHAGGDGLSPADLLDAAAAAWAEAAYLGAAEARAARFADALGRGLGAALSAQEAAAGWAADLGAPSAGPETSAVTEAFQAARARG